MFIRIFRIRCRKTVEATLEAFGRLDILFNNAGAYFPDNSVDCSEEEWDFTIDINLKGTFLMSKFVLMTKAMAIDHAAQGIRVNCLCPGGM